MAGEEKIVVDGQEVQGDEQAVVTNPNEPELKPLSETGYKINPDGSVGRPGEEWDSK